MIDDTLDPIDARVVERHCSEEQLAGFALDKLQPVEMALVEAHIELCTRCAQVVSWWRSLEEEPEPSEESGVWQTLRGGIRTLTEPIRLKLSKLGSLIPVHGPPPQHEAIVGTTLRSAALIEVHTWAFEDRGQTVRLQIRLADAAMQRFEIGVVLAPRIPAQLEITDDSGQVFVSGPLENFYRLPACVGMGRWLLRVTAPSSDGERTWALPIELRDGVE